MQPIPSPGDTLLGKYRVERRLAEGGMGVVLEATHLQLEERVAIKLLKPEVIGNGGDTSVVARFLQEARAAIKIRSEHVVRVIDVGTLGDDGLPYIVMELLEGTDLDERVMQGGPLPLAEAAEYLLQACEALAEAHGRGIIHRDLKPANLFLTRRADGSACVKVLDFGISKVQTKTDVAITSTSAVMGSPRYMSPEQMRATRSVDVRADIWAIGVILYELVTGRPPFDGATLTEVCAAIVADTPAPLTALRPELPAGIDAVSARCLAKDPAQRYANVAELAEALAPFAGAAGPVAAARIARILRVEVPASSPSLAVATSASQPNLVEARSGSVGMTSTAWGEAPLVARRRSSVGVLVGAVAAVLLVGVGAGVFALRTRTVATGGPTATLAAPPEPVATIPATAAPAAPAPSASDDVQPPPTASSAEPSSAPSGLAAAPPKATTKGHGGHAPIPTATTTAKKPAPGKDLWGERK